MSGDWVDALIAGLTPEELAALVERLADAQSEGNRRAVSVGAIVDALAGGRDLGTGSEGWERTLRLQQAVCTLAGRAPGMRYVEGDA